MRSVQRGLAGMSLAAMATVAGFSVVTRPAVADDMTSSTTDMPMDMGMTTGTTCAWGVSLSISAQDGSFDKDCLAAPPGETFTISLENEEPIAHNIAILPSHDSSEVLFRGEAITGPGSITYSVGPLSLGRYHFHCEMHPTTMMGTFALGGPAAFTSPGGMMLMSSPPGRMPRAGASTTDEGAGPIRTFALVTGIGLVCAGGLFLAGRSRRRMRRTEVQTEGADVPPAATASDTDVGRRQLVKLGTAGVAGAVFAKLATSGPPAGASARLGGIHISVLTQLVSPEAFKGFPHHWTLTVYGPDNDLNGMGWGGATDLKTAQDVFNSKMLPCIYSLTGAVEGDLVKVSGLMLFSGAPDQGLPLTFEGNLKTGALHVNAYNTSDFEGTGVVARI